jgi:hypothetical protein
MAFSSDNDHTNDETNKTVRMSTYLVKTVWTCQAIDSAIAAKSPSWPKLPASFGWPQVFVANSGDPSDSSKRDKPVLKVTKQF